MKNSPIQIVGSNILYFEAFYPNHPELIINNYDPENPGIFVTGGFDNTLLEDGLRHIYIDIELTMLPFGAILVRSEFEFEPNGELWDDLFTMKFIHPMVDLAFRETTFTFNEQYELEQKKKPDEILVYDEIISVISKDIVNQYNNSRKPHDLENADLKKAFGLECLQSTATFITIQGTFMIIDELIYNNPLFNRKHNRAALGRFIHESKYNTLKMKCLEITEHPVNLSFYDAIFFYICVDCALQMLVDDKGDLMSDSLEANGMVQKVRAVFIRHGIELCDKLHESLSRTNSTISNLEVERDWNNLFE